MSLIDQIGEGTNPAVNRMRAYFINSERKLNFGTRSLKLFEMTSDGLSSLIELEEDWTARHVINPKLGLDHWEMEIIESEDLTAGIINKIAVVKIGDDHEFKAPKLSIPGTTNGLWSLILELA